MMQFYDKTPQEMSRKEIGELEKQLQDIDEVFTDEPIGKEDDEINLK